MLKFDGSNWVAANPTAGTVTSVGMTVPSILSVSGGPVTGSGTLSVSLSSQVANTVFAAPNGAAGTPSFRTLKINDIFSTIGGQSFLNTVPSCSAGTALIYVSATDRIECSAVTAAWANITGKPTTLAGYGITDGVTSVSSANSFITVTNGASTPIITANIGTVANTLAAGNDARFTDSRTPAGSAGGDLGGSYPNPSVNKIRGFNVASTTPLDGQVYRFNNSTTQFEPVYFGIDDLRTAAGASQFSASCASSQTLTWSAVTDAFTCANIANLDASVIATGTIASARLPASATYWSAATGGINFSGGNVGVGTATPGQKLSVNGVIESTSGGFKFPDGSTQTTAAVSGAGYTQLTPQTVEPFTCDASNDGTLALTNTLAIGGNTSLGPANSYWDGTASSSTLMTAYSVPGFSFTIAQSAAIIKHLKFARIMFESSVKGKNVYLSASTNSSFATKKAALTPWTKESGALDNLEWNGSDRNGYTYSDYLLGVKDPTWTSAYGDTFGTWSIGVNVWAMSGTYPINIAYQNGTSTGMSVVSTTAVTIAATGHRDSTDASLAIWFK